LCFPTVSHVSVLFSPFLVLQKKQRLMETSASRLPPEPPAQRGQTVSVSLRFPTGERSVRRFACTSPLQVLLDYIQSRGFLLDLHSVVTQPPRKVLYAPPEDDDEADDAVYDTSVTLADLGFDPAGQVVFVEQTVEE
jgi:hypothetical protein